MRLLTFAVYSMLTSVKTALSKPNPLRALLVDNPARSNDSIDDPSQVPFKACKGKAMNESLFEIAEINLSPNPPQVGRNLDIAVRGHLKQDADEGSIMKVSIKTGALTSKKLEYDFCEGVNTTCPVEAGEVRFRKLQWIDPRIPTFLHYKLKVELFDKDDLRKALSCVLVPIKLARPPKSSKRDPL